MNHAEAKALLLQETSKYRARSYTDLKALLGHQETYEVRGPSGVVYQLEIDVFWDDQPDGAIRVLAAIDDQGVRAFMPMVEGFLKTADGTLVGE